MADNENTNPDRGGIENLSDKDRKETQEILDEIENSGKDSQADGKKEEDQKPSGEKPEEKPDLPPKKADEDGTKKNDDKGDKGKKPEERRPTKLIPAEVFYTHRAKTEQQVKELQAEIDRLKGTSTSQQDKKEDTPDDSEKKDQVDTRIDALKKKWEEKGYDPDLISDMAALAMQNDGRLPKEVSERLETIDKIKNEREAEAEEISFNADFDKVVLPLIKTEYGDDVPKAVIEEIRENLKGMAYQEEYGKVPYEVIYKGKDMFRGVIPPKKKSAESSRGGTEDGATDRSEKPDLTKPLSDEEVEKLSPEDFDKYSDNMARIENPNSRK